MRKGAVDAILRMISNLEEFVMKYKNKGQRVLHQSMVEKMDSNEKETFDELRK